MKARADVVYIEEIEGRALRLLRADVLLDEVGRIENVAGLAEVVMFRSVWSNALRGYGSRAERSLCSQRRHILGTLDILAGE